MVKKHFLCFILIPDQFATLTLIRFNLKVINLQNICIHIFA